MAFAHRLEVDLRLLKIVATVVGSHDARKIRPDSVGRRIIPREHIPGRGRAKAGAVDSQAIGLPR
jgi:hypothetical protein